MKKKDKNKFETNKIYMTKESIENLKLKLVDLVNNVRTDVLVELSEARKQGDLSENADYDAARNRQAEVESEISKIESVLLVVEEISEVNNDTIEISNIVEFENMDSKVIKTIRLVSSSFEVEPFSNIANVAIDTPIGKSLLGKQNQEIVVVETPKGKIQLKILSISS